MVSICPFGRLVGSRNGAYLDFPDSLWKRNSQKFGCTMLNSVPIGVELCAIPLWACPSSRRRTRRTEGARTRTSGQPLHGSSPCLPGRVRPSHVVMADLRAHHLRLDRLFIYLYETRPLQHQQASDEQETEHQRRDQYSVCHELHHPSIHECRGMGILGSSRSKLPTRAAPSRSPRRCRFLAPP